MKKIILLITILMSITLTSCGQKADPYYSSPEDVTIESIQERLSMDTILQQAGGVKVDISSQNHITDESTEYTMVCAKDKDYRQISITYSVPVKYSTFVSDNPADRYYYISSDDSQSAIPFTEDIISELFASPVFELPSNEISGFSCEKEGNYFIAKAEYLGVEAKMEIIFTINPISGLPIEISSVIQLNGEEYYSETRRFEYSKKIKVDTSAKDMVGTPDEKLKFQSTDINGEAVDDSIISGYKVIMLNFWEPWCGPCVGEMPDIQKLYEKYEAEGLLVIGVYSTEDGADTVAQQNQITYPLVKNRGSLTQFSSEYVPTTIFFDGDGNKLSDQYIGAKGYEDWEEIIKQYLK